MFNCGDMVLFSTDGLLKTSIGIVIKVKKDAEYAILTDYRIYKNIKESWITSIEDVVSVRDEVLSYYSGQIIEKEKLIRKPTQEEKLAEKTLKYNQMEKRIITCAKRMIESKGNAEFECKLNEIYQLKKQLFSIKLDDCVNEIRKENGRIKRDIKN